MSPVLFNLFMQRVFRCSQWCKVVLFGNYTIVYLLFADDMVMLASLSQNLNYTLGQFAVECEADVMTISTYKCKAMVLHWKKVTCPCSVGGEPLPWGQMFKDLQYQK